MPNNTHFAEQINQAQHQAMSDDPNMICMGLGIDDPKAIFGTTAGLSEKFGSQRVFDMPTAENAMTGIGIGAAIAGTRVLMTHQRVDFFLLAMDQLVNNAAKWHYMFNGTMSVPLTIRLIIGRGWGQGPTHQQSLQSWFTHIPGLKVVVPGLTDNVGQLLYQAINDNNPTIFLEHRWLHNQSCLQSACLDFSTKHATTRFHSTGDDIALISNSYMMVETLHAAKCLAQQNIWCDVIEICEPSNVDWPVIYNSVKKTGRCIIADIGHRSFSVSAEISAKITEACFSELKAAPVRIGLPDYAEPTSFSLTKSYYHDASQIVSQVANLLSLNPESLLKNIDEKPSQHDIPGEWFTGPF